MPSSPGGIRVNPNGQSAVVTFTLPNGGTPVAYSSKSGAGTISLPATVTTETTFWFQEQTVLTVSALVGTQQSATAAGTTAAVDLSAGGVAGLLVAVVAASGGSSIAPTIVDAAGDLIVGTANDTVGRLPKGQPFQFLRVNGAGTGLEYAAPRRTLVAVAENCFAAAGINGPYTTVQTSRKPHTVNVDASDLVFVFGNWYSAGGTHIDTDGPSSITIKASVSIGGTIYRLTFRGATSVTIDPGGRVQSDPLAVEVAAGTLIQSLTFIDPGSGTWYSNTASYDGAGSGGRTITTDLTAPGSAAIADGTAFLYAPFAILGNVRAGVGAPATAIIGDSIGAGTSDNGEGGGYNTSNPTGSGGGFVARALHGRSGVISLARAGDRLDQFVVTNGHFRRGTLLEYVSNAIVQLGINDFDNGVSLATMKTNALTTWTFLARRGVTAFATTTTPHSSSTDGYVTTVNQSIQSAPSNTVRTGWNDYLRAGAPIDPATLAPVAIGTSGALVTNYWDSTGTLVVTSNTTLHPLAGGVFEIADLAEPTRNAGIWRANYTGDGLHPNATGSAAIAAGVKYAALVGAR